MENSTYITANIISIISIISIIARLIPGISLWYLHQEVKCLKSNTISHQLW
jgi:hypothetical protein